MTIEEYWSRFAEEKKISSPEMRAAFFAGAAAVLTEITQDADSNEDGMYVFDNLKLQNALSHLFHETERAIGAGS